MKSLKTIFEETITEGKFEIVDPDGKSTTGKYKGKPSQSLATDIVTGKFKVDVKKVTGDEHGDNMWTIHTDKGLYDISLESISEAKKVPKNLLPLEELGAFFNTKTNTVHPMNKDGSPDLNDGVAVDVDDLDMPDLFELQSALKREHGYKLKV